MTPRRALSALLLCVACGNIGSPEIISSQVYEFRYVVHGKTLIFHWPRSVLPVRFWVAADSPLRPYLQTAIDRWQGAFLYGEFRGQVVADSTVADVIVRNEPPDLGGIAARAPQCDGVTDPGIDPDSGAVQLPMHVFVYPVVSPSTPGIPACYSITMTHELGHVLGIIDPSHSGTTSADVMFANPSLDGISDRDRLTAVILYSVAPTITIIGRR